jgi:competence protein ComEC
MITGISYWLLEKKKSGVWVGIISLLFFVSLQSISLYQSNQQQKIIVYNMPKHQAIDVASGNDYQFIGDSSLSKDAVLQNLNLKPARLVLQLKNRSDSMKRVFRQGIFLQFNEKRIVLIDKMINFGPVQQKIDVDLIIISKNPKLYIPQLAKVFNCRQYIFDSSNSLWKIAKWQKDCDALNLQCYSIPEQGAFISDL